MLKHFLSAFTPPVLWDQGGGPNSEISDQPAKSFLSTMPAAFMLPAFSTHTQCVALCGDTSHSKHREARWQRAMFAKKPKFFQEAESPSPCYNAAKVIKHF